MASANILELRSGARRCRLEPVADASSWREVVLATRLSECLSEIENGASIGSVVANMEADVANEIAPLLEIAQSLRERKSTLHVC